MNDAYDVLIIGAGLSGIGMACHLQRECPGKRFAILERRHAIGGTWDLFRYPGIRSDSDMLTFGYEFRPWYELKVLADGESIRNYVRDTAREYGVDSKIQYGLKITAADWSSSDALGPSPRSKRPAARSSSSRRACWSAAPATTTTTRATCRTSRVPSASRASRSIPSSGRKSSITAARRW